MPTMPRNPIPVRPESEDQPVMTVSSPRAARSVCDALAAGDATYAITYAGQGVDPLVELEALYADPAVAPWIRKASDALREYSQSQRARMSGLFGDEFDLLGWLAGTTPRPPAHRLVASSHSIPLIYTAQVARLLWLLDRGLDRAFESGKLVATAGHSQGLVTAALTSEWVKTGVSLDRAVDYLLFAFWEGVFMEVGFYRYGAQGPGTPMAAVSGPRTEQLEALIGQALRGVPDDQGVDIALYNTPTRHVLSGLPASLARVQGYLESVAQRQTEARKTGQHGGAPLQFTWENLSVGGAFHSRYMAAAMEAMREVFGPDDFAPNPSDMAVAVHNDTDGGRFDEFAGPAEALDALMRSQFIEPVCWSVTLDAVRAHGPAVVLDLGPSDGVLRLTFSNLKGSGVEAISAVTTNGLARLLERTPGPFAPQATSYAKYLPTLATLPSGTTVVDNAYTRATGDSPIVLPGMTPTTVDVPIVAAAANAGFTAELAGGGQVTEAIFWNRMAELNQALEPGRGAVFNALYLDRYLWGLHFEKAKLVQKAAAAGLPLRGVTVSAGIPPVDEAVALLDELTELGVRINAFKPGTVAQVKSVCDIAKAAPHHQVIMHLEGGLAGGHHSWEDLDELLLGNYDRIRAHDNLLLAVGGGIGTPERAAELLTGRWSARYGRVPMPVDAVLLGTATMAALEATTSPQVKAALVEAAGQAGWVKRGQASGGVTSGLSQLDADIHYLDNAAARCGRLLDQVAGDADAVAARREEIIAALNATARPYFGDLDTMTWFEVCVRFFSLTAIGRGGRYEDGAWLDVTWRQRALDVIRRAEARLASDSGAASLFADGAALDAPATAIERLVEAFPAATTTGLLPQDIDWFAATVCARPGKPVPFVPVLDADVRRWYKADSLWAAHDARFEADQVLVIPGPAAVAGIQQADEPIASLLGRFEATVVEQLVSNDADRREAPARATPLEAPNLSDAYRLEDAAEANGSAARGHVLRGQGTGSLQWLAYLSGRLTGPVAELLGSAQVRIGTRTRANPVHRLAHTDRPFTVEWSATERHIDRVQWSDGHDAFVLTASGEGGVELSVRAQPLHRSASEAADAPGTTAKVQFFRYAHRGSGGGAYFAPEAEWARMVAKLYGATMGKAGAPLFEPVRAKRTIDAAVSEAFAAQAGVYAQADHVVPTAAFAMCWETLLPLLAHAEVAPGLLHLVHASHRVQVVNESAWPKRLGDEVGVESVITRIRDTAAGRELDIESAIRDDEGGLLVRLADRFFIRLPHGDTPVAERAAQSVEAQWELDDAGRAFLEAHAWLHPQDAWASSEHTTESAAFVGEFSSERTRDGQASWKAHGTLTSGGRTLATIELDQVESATEAAAMHPVRAALQSLGAVFADAKPTSQAAASLALASEMRHAPRTMDAYAEASGDLNPIHRSAATARLAGLGAPIAHGMWTASQLMGAAAKALRGGASSIRHFEAEFMAPVLPGEEVHLSVRRIGLRQGSPRLEALATVLRDGQRTVAVRADLEVAAPRTAYVFPGQGIQQANMGMDGYARSRAAKEIWDRADAYTRAELGFSILAIVRDNPRELRVGTTVQRHPSGVLYLTQFTQVAMAVLARAQIAEMEEADAIAPGSITCGHSLGEYNALSAVLGVMPIEGVVSIVYARGQAMHALVPRDAAGRSNYAMGVVRPHHAGLNQAGAEALVAEVAERAGSFIAIVNYNIRDRQYSVTGERAGLEALAAELETRRKPGGKPPWILVPGVDVPFHSRVLANGVPSFRATLEACLPVFDDAILERLEARYIPNLNPRPFALDREWIAEIQQETGSEPLAGLLANWDATMADRPAAARTLLVELLAWQFASPVRWIETQELLFDRTGGVDRVVEIGVGYQPTLSNMAKASLTRRPDVQGLEVLNAEADRPVVFAEDEAELDAPTFAAESTPEVAAPTDQAPAPVEAAPAPAAEAPAAAAVPAAAAPAAAGSDGAAVPALTVAEAVRAVLALQAKVRIDQLSANETIDELFEGVSSRRNQVLMDIGAELDIGAVDGAHELPMVDLISTLEGKAKRYRAPGRYLAGARDEAIARVFGRTGMSRAALEDHLKQRFGLGDEAAACSVTAAAWAMRDGESLRGGALATAAAAPAGSKDEAKSQIEAVAQGYAAERGHTLAAAAAGGGGGSAVDAAVVQELEDRILGETGVLMTAARDLAERLGTNLAPKAAPTEAPTASAMEAEMGEEFAQAVAPRFDGLKHVPLMSSWAWARRDLCRLALDALNGRVAGAEIHAEAKRLAAFAGDSQIRDTAAWFARRAEQAGHAELTAALGTFDAPHVEPPGGATGSWALELLESGKLSLGAPDADASWRSTLEAEEVPDFRGRTALVTGASPGSIALEVVAWLLRGGARVVVTTTRASDERIRLYRRFYQLHAAPGAELHIVPFNQASRQDVESLIRWLFDQQVETVGASAKVTKAPWVVDLLVPFGAMRDLGTLNHLETSSEAALRALLIGVERLVAGIAAEHLRRGTVGRPLHVVLPLSPNHGAFGGDGMYAEGKAALEALLTKWRSESDAWGRAATLVGARIGWVRSTGLMDANDAVAPGLESRYDLRTFSAPEMGQLIASLAAEPTRALASEAPIVADLTAGFDQVPDLKAAVQAIRDDLERDQKHSKRLEALQQAERRALGREAANEATIDALPAGPMALAPPFRPLDVEERPGWPALPSDVDLHDVAVIVGMAELGPCGTTRTRFEIEVDDRLSDAGVLELAWLCGLVRYEEAGRGGGHWVDIETDEPIDESQIAARYEAAVRERSGIRFMDPKGLPFDPDALPVWTTAWLDRDFTFSVSSEAEAQEFVGADPEHTRIRFDAAEDTWKVTRQAGSAVRVPRQTRFSRRVGGQLPTGYDPTRYGVPRDMADMTDPLGLYNLICTVDAFRSAGFEPEELLAKVHPARIGNTQGGGMGGMKSLTQLYTHHLLGEPRQADVLQESLINVVAGYVVQSYVGSYGTMSHPVGACATGAVSLEDAVDKLRADKADFIIAGGFDDLSREGVVGFTDMNATASTDEMLERGIPPHAMSRPNDARRRGFVEAQGGGVQLVTRASVAAEMGLPVHAVVGYVGSFSDGIQTSIPAPGKGLVAAAMGGLDSPLGRALSRWGLTADDIGVVYKHDTSTAANDPNENDIHHTIQNALGRTPGNPLYIVSQKSLTGHSKGGAAAWQLHGLTQAMLQGRIAGNRSLESVDPAMAKFSHLTFSDQALDPGPAVPLRAGLVSSLGFGHVAGIVLLLHRDAFVRALDDDQREAYIARADARLADARRWQARVLTGKEPHFVKRTERPFGDGEAGDAAEKAMLLDPAARLHTPDAT